MNQYANRWVTWRSWNSNLKWGQSRKVEIRDCIKYWAIKKGEKVFNLLGDIALGEKMSSVLMCRREFSHGEEILCVWYLFERKFRLFVCLSTVDLSIPPFNTELSIVGWKTFCWQWKIGRKRRIQKWEYKSVEAFCDTVNKQSDREGERETINGYDAHLKGNQKMMFFVCLGVFQSGCCEWKRQNERDTERAKNEGFRFELCVMEHCFRNSVNKPAESREKE